jgi:flavodoxin
MSDKKILIAYYSHSGNTKEAAEKIQSLTGGDLFEIKPANEYPKDYNAVVNQAKQEKADDVRPELVSLGNVKAYDILFIGTPVWWYTMASPVKTFLAENNFDGKIIVPFCTHGGGGASSTYTDIKNLAQGAEVKEGYTSYENSANIEEIGKWINSLNL